jgi:putative ABC transport system permease protein
MGERQAAEKASTMNWHDRVFRVAAGQLDILRHDLAYAIRMLARRPALTFTAVLTLALGIGANTAIFSVVNGVLFAPFDYRDADELVLVEEQSAGREPGMTGYPTYADLRNETLTIQSMSALSGWAATFAGDGRDAERVDGARVTWNYFRTVGLTPAIGRDFEQSEDIVAGPRVVIISDSLWRRRYGADPNVVGRQVTVNQQTFTLAGVLPPNADDIITARKFPNTEIWTLLQYSGQAGPPACRQCRHLSVVARLKADVTPIAAAADLTRIFQSLATRFPTDYDRPRPAVTPLRDYVLGRVKTPLYLLWGAVALLLLFACANIANLLLIRASERHDEIAVRRALGVSPARLRRQLLTEALVLAVIGGAAGTAVAFWATALLTTNGPSEIPRLSDVSPDARVLAYAFALSLVTGALCSLAPTRMLVGSNGAAIGSRRATSGPGVWRHRAALIAGNVALCVLLLIGSGLLVRSFARLLMVDSGFAPHQLLTFQINLNGERYQQNTAVTQFFDDLTARLRMTPGVVNVSSSSMLPLTDSMARMTVQIEGRPLENPAAAPSADTYAVRPDYFETTGVSLLRGRRFDYTDGERAAPVVIISKTMAEELWPGEDPIGRRIRVPGAPVYPLRTIVGIVGDVRHFGLHLPATPQAYIPHAQPPWPMRVMTVVVRAAAEHDPLSLVSVVREHVRSIDPLQPVTRIQTFDDIVAQSMATRRFTLVLLASFAGTAMLLAIGGLYGALSYIVSQRARDIGVRVALGASARVIYGLVIRQGMMPAIVGLGAGLLASVAIGRVVESMLFGVSPRDIVTYATVITVILTGALAACLLPAHRAGSVDAAVTLRAE